MQAILYALPVFMALILVEYGVARWRGATVFRLKDSLTSLNIGVMSECAKALIGAVSVVIYALIESRFGAYQWDLRHPLTWLSALLLYDFCYYWVHRTGHEINIFWASHVVHHSSEEFNLTTALRQSATGFLFRWIFYVPLALLGYPVQVFIVVGLIDLLYQYWVHTQLIGRLGWLEYVLITPSNHRVHHGQNDYCIDRNYGGVLCIWDRLFGTYADERADDKPVYGIRTPLQSWNPLWANLHHYAHIWQQIRRAPNWRHKLMYLFGKPSWTPTVADATGHFVASSFARYDTAASPALLRLQVLGTAVASLLLAAFYVAYPGLTTVARVAWCVAMIAGLAALGWLLTRSGRTGASPVATRQD